MNQEEHPPHIQVLEASIDFADGTSFHATDLLIKELNERVSKEKMLTIPTSGADGDYCLTWIEC